MTFDEFLDELNKNEICYIKDYGAKYERSSYQKNPTLVKAGKLAVSVKWVTGGVGGGSCWDEDNHYAMEGEEEPPFTELDSILKTICPDISYLKYKMLREEIINFDSTTEYEYYGNSTTYGIKYVYLEDLHAFLLTHGLI